MLLALIVSAGIFLFIESWEKITIKPADTPCKACFYLGVIFVISYTGVAFASTKIPRVDISFGTQCQYSKGQLDVIISKYKKQDYVAGRLVYINAKLEKVMQTDIDIKHRLKRHKKRTEEEYDNQNRLIARVNNYNHTAKKILYPDLIPPPNNIIDPPVLDANYKAIKVFIEDIEKNIGNFNRVDSDSIGIVKELDEIERKQLPTNRKLTNKEVAFDEVEYSQRKLGACLIKHNF